MEKLVTSVLESTHNHVLFTCVSIMIKLNLPGNSLHTYYYTVTRHDSSTAETIV